MQDKSFILLINPPAVDFKAYDLWLKPLGLLSIGKVLRDRGYKVKLFDFLDRLHPAVRDFGRKWGKPSGGGKFYYEEIEKPEIFRDIPRKFKRYGVPLPVFKEELKKFSPPSLILVTTLFTYWYSGAVEVIKILRGTFPKSPVVLGGIYPSICYNHAKEKSGADFVFQQQNFPGAINFIENLLGQEIPPSLNDNFPCPDFSFYPEFSYACLFLSLGCPFRCSYCASSVLQPEMKWAEADRLAEAVISLHKDKKISDFALFDDALLYQPEKCFLPFMEKIISSGLKLYFHTPNALHPVFLTPEAAEYLYKANFSTIRLGFEIEDEMMQKKMGGKVTSEQLEWAILNLIRAGFKKENIGVYILAGYPGISSNAVRKSIEFVYKLGAKSFIAQFSPIPGTKAGDEFLTGNLKDIPFDPYFTNNTYWWYKSPEISFEELENLRLLSNNLNHSL
ncbi:MAG: radical SAM protein [Firmicutes bacterium]|nr:radical SAM protein [Bacillota bacterium]